MMVGLILQKIVDLIITSLHSGEINIFIFPLMELMSAVYF